MSLDKVDRDDEERTGEAVLDDRLGFAGAESSAANAGLDLARESVPLPFDDLPVKEDDFETSTLVSFMIASRFIGEAAARPRIAMCRRP